MIKRLFKVLYYLFKGLSFTIVIPLGFVFITLYSVCKYIYNGEYNAGDQIESLMEWYFSDLY